MKTKLFIICLTLLQFSSYAVMVNPRPRSSGRVTNGPVYHGNAARKGAAPRSLAEKLFERYKPKPRPKPYMRR